MGLREGDVVIEVSDVPISDMATLRRTIASSEAHAIQVKWIRKGTVHVGRMDSH
jgi:S1-C subfamily serine protease